MQFRQLRSSFNDPEDVMLHFDFETSEELFSHDYIKWHMKQPHFTRFSLTNDHTLMAEYKNGFEWWVVGYINYPESLNLPKWKPKYFIQYPSGFRTVLENGEVISICGTEGTLRDGTLVRICK